MYKKAADLYANELCDELIASGLIDHLDVWCGQTDEPITLTKCSSGDRNFILWSLIPYITALSGEKLMDERIHFEEVATIPPRRSAQYCACRRCSRQYDFANGLCVYEEFLRSVYI